MIPLFTNLQPCLSIPSWIHVTRVFTMIMRTLLVLIILQFVAVRGEARLRREIDEPVSYTHLTLPTILLV